MKFEDSVSVYVCGALTPQGPYRAKTGILSEVTCSLHNNYVGITFLSSGADYHLDYSLSSSTGLLHSKVEYMSSTQIHLRNN